MTKKQIRDAFRNAVLKRDKNQCVMCGKKGQLDAHHIKDRKLIVNGGYVKENGISLCSGEDKDNCHWKAEQYHVTGVPYLGYSPEELFEKIGSSLELATEASQALGPISPVYVKIVLDEGKTLYGVVSDTIHDTGPAWPALYEINFGTEERPELKLYYEDGEGYELFFIPKKVYEEQN